MMADIDLFTFECDDGGGDERLPTVGEELRDMWQCVRRRPHGPRHRPRRLGRGRPCGPARVHRLGSPVSSPAPPPDGDFRPGGSRPTFT